MVSIHQLLRVRRCLPPVWRHVAPAKKKRPRPPKTSPASYLSTLLRSCTAHRSGEQIHARAVTLGLYAHRSVLPRLASLYIALGDLPAARAAIEQANGKARAFPWNLLIWGYVKGRMWKDVILAYGKMVALGVDADNFTYPSVLRACAELQINQRILIPSSNEDLVDMDASVGELEDAQRVFAEMPVGDVVTWNMMVSGYASLGMWDEAFQLLQQAPETNVVTWNGIAAAYLNAGNYDEAIRLVSQMRNSLHEPGVDSVTLLIGLKACSKSGYLRAGRELHGAAVRLYFDELGYVLNSLITMYSRGSMMSSAVLLFRMCSNQDIATWNSLLAGLVFMGQVEEASLLFRDIVSLGICPNNITLLTMLSLSARSRHLNHGRELHCYIVKHELDCYNLLENSLVDMYSKCSHMTASQRVFDRMECRDKYAYTSLIFGYGMQKEGHVSLKLFDEMVVNGIEPDHVTMVAILSACSHSDHVTMVAILSACSHSRLVIEGQLLFTKMFDVFSIVPRVEHFSCMVDLYSREGLLKMAEKIIDKMPFDPTAAMLVTLIEACQIHGNTDIGERAATKLLDMRTNNRGHYKLISNMYRLAKCWPELDKVRLEMSIM